MSECWSAGGLRAWIDRELPPGEMARAAAHVAECGRCAALYAEVARRAERVAGLLETLETGRACPNLVAARAVPVRALLALAATIVIAFAVQPKRPAAPAAAAREATPPQVYLALDDDPVDAGVIVRVTLGPQQIPADVLVDSAGHARAVRLVGWTRGEQ